MNCVRCNSTRLVLSALTEVERRNYPLAGIVLRQCRGCGVHQNHYQPAEVNRANPEPLDPWEAAEHAPRAGDNGLVTLARKIWAKPTAKIKADRARAEAGVREIRVDGVKL